MALLSTRIESILSSPSYFAAPICTMLLEGKTLEQWSAVMTMSGAMSVPPQPPSLCAKNGNSLAPAPTPPIIRCDKSSSLSWRRQSNFVLGRLVSGSGWVSSLAFARPWSLAWVDATRREARIAVRRNMLVCLVCFLNQGYFACPENGLC